MSEKENVMIKFLTQMFQNPKKTEPVALDFSHIDSKDKLAAAVAAETLFPILLFPEAFGGEAIEVNTVYVPAGIAETQHKIIGTLLRLIEEGMVDGLKAYPENKGDSLVPCKIHIQTSKDGVQGQFNPSIEIW